MEQQRARIEQHRAIEDYAAWLARTLKQQGVSLLVVGENALHVKGELTPAQSEAVRLWKQNLINALSPKCSNCTLALQLINDGTLWFCPFGCESREAL